MRPTVCPVCKSSGVPIYRRFTVSIFFPIKCNECGANLNIEHKYQIVLICIVMLGFLFVFYLVGIFNSWGPLVIYGVVVVLAHILLALALPFKVVNKKIENKQLTTTKNE